MYRRRRERDSVRRDCGGSGKVSTRDSPSGRSESDLPSRKKRFGKHTKVRVRFGERRERLGGVEDRAEKGLFENERYSGRTLPINVIAVLSAHWLLGHHCRGICDGGQIY